MTDKVDQHQKIREDAEVDIISGVERISQSLTEQLGERCGQASIILFEFGQLGDAMNALAAAAKVGDQAGCERAIGHAQTVMASVISRFLMGIDPAEQDSIIAATDEMLRMRALRLQAMFTQMANATQAAGEAAALH